MNCPKCGFQQDDGTECLHCGIIFARYHSGAASPPPEAKSGFVRDQSGPGAFRRFYRIFRWVLLAATLLTLFLMLRPCSAPQIEASPAAAKSAEAKVSAFEASLGRGTEQTLEMDEPELNGWLRQNLALKKTAGSRAAIPQNTESLIEMAKVATGGHAVSSGEIEQAQSSVRDVRIELHEDSLLIYALFDLHGLDLSLELEGQPQVRDGYLRLDASRGKLGSLPLMAGTLQSATSRIFDSPGNKEKFKLPPGISDIRVEDSRLVVVSR